MLAPSCPPSHPLVLSPAGCALLQRILQAILQAILQKLQGIREEGGSEMANAVIVGMQWGDEGKGKIVDLLCPAFDGVVRYQGGKAGRRDVRRVAACAPDLEERLRVLLSRIQVELTALGGRSLPSPSVYADMCRTWGERVKPSLRDTEQLLNGWIREGKSLLFEGAQGSLLDIDHGTYPFVTSSNSTTGGACTGTGVPPTRIDGAIGVLKAYTTRVGGGPFPSELTDATGEFLRRRGNEFGTVTGRPRRCGWFDAVAARYGQLLNGVSTVALTKLDVLDDFDEIPVCVAYKLHGETLRDFPPDRRSLEAAEPVLRTFKGWKRSTVGALEWPDLPQEARDYVDFLEQEIEAPVTLVSTGPRREETIVRSHPDLDRLTSGRLGRVLEQR